MPEIRLLFTILAVLVPAAGSLFLRGRTSGRRIASASAACSLAFSLAAVLSRDGAVLWLSMDDLAAGPIVMFTSVVLTLFATAPERDLNSSTCARMLIGLSGTLLMYASANPFALFAGWAISAIPLLQPSRFRGASGIRLYANPAVMLSLSVVMVGASLLLISFPVIGHSGTLLAFGLAVAGALIRNGIFPFHSWVITAFEEENVSPSVAVVTAQAGAFVIARFVTPAFAEPARIFFPALSDLALFSTILMAFMALGEKKPRRILALVVASQSGFIICGLGVRNLEGVTGALVHWIVVSVSTAGLIAVLRSLEARCRSWLEQPFAGLAARTPRLAVLFLLFALSLVGLPGSLGFAAEDLLFRGALDAHPMLGVALPIATSLSAFHLLRLFSSLFLGRREIELPLIPDGLRRERWALTAMALFLILTGLMPGLVVKSRASSAKSLASVPASHAAMLPVSASH